MKLSDILNRLFAKTTRSRSLRPAQQRARLEVEGLESRLVPYSVSGNAWPHAELVTLSFMPDGTNLGGVTSNLFQTFNQKFGSASAWQTTILKAAQVWAQQTNLNFSVVADSGADSGSGNYEQGDPTIGDIRIGGFAFGSSTLAMAYMPPPANNYSLAGDISFNTGQAFHIGTTYDLFTVALHEFGHALGLEHSSSGTAAAMYPSYTSAKQSLNSDDIAGIRNIYSSNHARSTDAYAGAATPDSSFATAADISALINPTTLTEQLPNLDITTTNTQEYFAVTAPAATSGTLTVNVQSQGLSLLSPNLTVYAADQQTVLGSASGLGHYGTTLTVTLNQVTAGQRFYLKVQGADSSAFSTGRYALTANFSSSPSPAVTPPNTQTLDGFPVNGSGGAADTNAQGDTYLDSVPAITGITPDTGLSSNDGVTSAQNIKLVGSAPEHDTVTVYLVSSNGKNTPIGTATMGGGNNWTFDYTGTTLSAGTYQFTATSTDSFGNISGYATPFTVVIDTTAPQKPNLMGISPDTGFSATDGITQVNTPTLQGTAPANSLVQIYQNGNTAVFGSVMADSNGNWSYQSQGLGDGTYSFTATATNLAGNVSNLCSALPVTIDTHAPNAPVITGISPDSGTAGDGVTNDPTIHLLGTAAPLNQVQVFNGGVSIGTAMSDGSGNWQFDYSHTTLANGTYSFTALGTDRAGNSSNLSHVYTVVIDLTRLPVPVVSGIKYDSGVSGSDCITNVPYQVFNGTSIPNGTVQVFLDGKSIGTIATDGSGNWSFDYSKTAISEGTHTVTAQVTDFVGNVSAMSAPMTLIIDLTAPIKPIITSWGPDSGMSATDGITNVNTPTFYGTTEAYGTVTVLDNGHALGTTTANATGAWQFTCPTLGDGVHPMTATATDLAGNMGQASQAINITIITKIGNVHVTGITPDTGAHNNDGITNARNIKILGQSDPGDTVQVFRGGASIGTTVANSQGNWIFDYTGTTLADGIYNFTASASDVAGNVSQLSQMLSVTIDTVAPNAPVIAGVIESTDASGNQILSSSGIAEAQSTVTVYCNGSVIGSTNADGQGKWHYDYKSTKFANGKYLFAATATDLAGNVGAQSLFNLLLGNGMQNLSVPKLTVASVLGVAGNGNPIAIATPTFTGNAKAGTQVTVVDGNMVLGTTVADASGHWTFTSPRLATGNHSVSVFATDSLGNQGLLSNPLAFQI
ncbi:MAG TPA: Ig-like domain-containing protein [Gemmataceae bacterium]|nr:Ig-like domain-containing protein [Gemmataceae bacterium]